MEPSQIVFKSDLSLSLNRTSFGGIGCSTGGVPLGQTPNRELFVRCIRIVLSACASVGPSVGLLFYQRFLCMFVPSLSW